MENRGAHLLLQNRRRTKKFFERKVSQRSESVWEDTSKTVQRLHRHNPVFQNYKTESGCRFGEKWASYSRISWQPAQQWTEEDWWSRFCYIDEDCQAIRLCIPEYGAADIQFDFTEGHKIFGATTQRAILIRYIKPRENLGKKASIARCDSAHWFSRAVSFCSKI